MTIERELSSGVVSIARTEFAYDGYIVSDQRRDPDNGLELIRMVKSVCELFPEHIGEHSSAILYKFDNMISDSRLKIASAGNLLFDGLKLSSPDDLKVIRDDSRREVLIAILNLDTKTLSGASGYLARSEFILCAQKMISVVQDNLGNAINLSDLLTQLPMCAVIQPFFDDEIIEIIVGKLSYPDTTAQLRPR
jgi:hypothetical protein